MVVEVVLVQVGPVVNATLAQVYLSRLLGVELLEQEALEVKVALVETA